MDSKTKIKHCITNKRLKTREASNDSQLSKAKQSKAMSTCHSLDRVRTHVKQERKAHSEQNKKNKNQSFRESRGNPLIKTRHLRVYYKLGKKKLKTLD